MASQVLAEISRSDLSGSQIPNATITRLQQLASYSWIEGSESTILVPGFPPLWSPPSKPLKLMPDSGMVFIDQNAARNTRCPLEPLFRALYAQDPGFEMGNIDLVTDRNNIRKLLRFVQGSSFDAFEFEVEIVGGKTALFTRLEPETTTVIQGFRGYGHSFEKAYTKSQVGSTGYHRVTRYYFGDMDYIVRHETDGFVGDEAKSVTITRAGEVTDGLSDSLKALSISQPDDAGTKTPAIVVRSEGRWVDSSLTLEIKTRAVGRTLDMAEVTPQLWIGQTPNLAVGYHRKGVFNDVQLRNMEHDIRQWEVANQRALGNLASLVRKIITLVKDSGHRNVVVKYGGGAKIQIVKSEQKRTLPDDLYSKWEDKVDVTVQDRSQDTTSLKAKSLSTDLAKLENKDNKTCDVSLPRSSGKDTTSSSIPDNIPFSDIIKFGVSHGFRQFFRRMPIQLSDYHVLCKQLKTLAIDVLRGRKMRDIMNDMRRGKSDWDPDERQQIEGLKSLARDSAFRLLYLFLLREFESDAKDQNMAYNATLFVVSHSGIFKCRTRKMVREAFDEQFHVSQKQRTTLNMWSINESSSQLQEEDVTTEVYDYGFDSDWSF
ncbi:hypothetical protein F4677DRAFT_438092 [Hypoxylon crocopeplum]|nr:hypothetical protein F4677DRAFT_438092 [Hypoxylon crocopeplum]